MEAMLLEGETYFVVTGGGTKAYQYVLQQTTEGISSRSLEVKLRRNAVVRKFDVVVQAARADYTTAQNVAQVRTGEPTHSISGGMAFVIDFGTPRTVSSIDVPSGLSILRITPWIGSSFAPAPSYTSSSSSDSASFPEVRTERLLVEVSGTKDLGQIGSGTHLVLPEAPSGLEIRIDGGAPAWTHPGPAQGGPDATLSDQSWNKDGKRIVHLGDAFTRLTGDPLHDQEVTFHVVLTSQVPGVLDIQPDAKDLSYIRRISFAGDTAKTLKFESEGDAYVDLTLPQPAQAGQRRIEEVRFTAIATLPAERVLPPVGPTAATLADLVLNPDRAACVRLAAGDPIAELAGVRLPLEAGASGAEARVVLWSNKGGGAQQPLEAIAGATTEPVTLRAATQEAWVSFRFKRPVPLKADPPWAALLVTRGEVTWTLGATPDTLADHLVRVGPPAGPWKLLPPPFQASGSPLGGARGRVHAIGLAARDRPVAPLLAGVAPQPATAAAATLEVTPTVKGAPVSLKSNPGILADQVSLVVVSRVAGDVTLRDIDVIATA